MKRAVWAGVVVVAIGGLVATAAIGATALVVALALVAVVFFSSLPWVIGAVMDRAKEGDRRAGAVIVRGFDEPDAG